MDSTRKLVEGVFGPGRQHESFTCKGEIGIFSSPWAIGIWFSHAYVAIKSRRKKKVHLTQVRPVELYSQLRAAKWKNQSWISQMPAKTFARSSLIQNKQSLKTRYFAMIYSMRLVEVYKAKRSPSFSGYVSTDMSVCRNSSHLQCYETQVIDRQCQPRLEKFHPCDEDTSTARLFCGVQTICSKNLNHLLQASTILLFSWPCTTCTSRSLHAK